MIDLNNLSPRQHTLICTCNIFGLLGEDSAVEPMDFLTGYENISPFLVWGQLCTLNSRNNLYVPIEDNMNDMTIKRVNNLNRFIKDDSMHNPKGTAFDTFYRWIYEENYHKSPDKIYSDHDEIHDGNEFKMNTVPNAGSFALKQILKFPEMISNRKVNILHNDPMIIFYSIFNDFNTYENEYSDFLHDIAAVLSDEIYASDIFKGADSSVAYYFTETFRDVIDRGNDDILVFDVLFEYYKEIYNVITATDISMMN